MMQVSEEIKRLLCINDTIRVILLTDHHFFYKTDTVYIAK